MRKKTPVSQLTNKYYGTLKWKTSIADAIIGVCGFGIAVCGFLLVALSWICAILMPIAIVGAIIYFICNQ